MCVCVWKKENNVESFNVDTIFGREGLMSNIKKLKISTKLNREIIMPTNRPFMSTDKAR